MRETRRAWACALLSAALLAGWFAPPAPAQERKRKPVVVSFGQPSIWSLEQAHYLLARMHQENLELRARSLAALDPNETHATRIEILKQMLGVGAEFDQSIAVNNSRIQRNNEFNDSRRQQLVTRRDSLQGESLALAREISRLEIERARMEADPSATAGAKTAKETEVAKKKDELAAVNQQITFHTGEIDKITAPSGSLASPTVTAPTPSTAGLPTGVLDGVAKAQIEKIITGTKDARLNAATMLDNHVQMQYEIIAKQLTLLRDEVGPGERLVFLEMPQSVYTTPGSGDEKMAQAWWHVNGYTRTDPLLRLLLELYEVERKWYDIQRVPLFRLYEDTMRSAEGRACDVYAATATARSEAERGKKVWREELERWERAQYRLQKPRPTTSDSQTPEPQPTPLAIPPKFTALTVDTDGKDPVAFETLLEFQCEYESARARLIRELFREARKEFARAQQGGARDTSEMVEAIRELLGVKSVTADPEHAKKREAEHAKGVKRELSRHAELDLTSMTAEERLWRGNDENRKALRLKLYEILSDPKTKIGPKDEFTFKNGIELVRMDDREDRAADGAFETPKKIELRTVRTVDIIPRQSSLNVNDIQNTVKATGILAAFKFLFGFAGQVNYQRQREQFEQFIHQELYASGFGKGNRDFGWTFGALPGTKRVAPGVRTTYAVLVVPDDAESLVLSARGCYFPRKSYSPLDFEDTTHKDWDREGKFRSYNCGDEQTYIIPIPGGGDRSNFWVTNVDYIAAGDGQRATVSIRGKNFSTQMGVLVNGVPLWPTVGLAQPLLARRGRTDGNANANTADGSNLALPQQDCATAENAGQNAGQKAAPKVCGNYERIDPEQIVVSFTVADKFQGIPTITLVAPGKAVDVNTLPNVTVNGVRNTRLADSDFVFGSRPRPHIADFQVFKVSADGDRTLALLTGAEFDAADEVFVNGKPLDEWAPGTPEPAEYKQFKSQKLYRLMFNKPPGDKVVVTVRKGDSAPVTKEFPVPKEGTPPGN
ncbi:MAG TPA: hypothetical protein VK422_01255 [Pyrinomonadaceae bacterium]|nr:hypothetical protein [Pyrinomonadaceae bacterium]